MRLVGWIGAPLTTCGVVFSTSRTTIGLAALTGVAIVAAGAVRPPRRDRVVRGGAALALCVGMTFLFTSPLMFHHSA